MARDLVDDTYYTVQSKGGKIPVKWTAPEVYVIKLCLILVSLIHENALYRLSSIESTPLIVMYGAMVWCCLRYGLLERSHFQRLLTKKF